MVSIDRTHILNGRMVDFVAGVIFTALTLASGVPAWAQTPPSPPPAEACTPGLVVDFCSDVPAAQGFLFDSGVFTTIEAPGASTTIPFGINSRGQIVGTYIDAGGPTAGGFTHGFLLNEKGAFTTIDFPGPSETELAGINNQGEIAGVYRDAEGITHGVLLDKKDNFTTIDAPNAVETALLDINNRGQIIGGYADIEGTVTYFLLDDGVFTPIEFPGASLTVPLDINNRGQIVGGYIDAGEERTVFCWQKAPSPQLMSISRALSERRSKGSTAAVR
jgi:uncharacterized membrane protein